MELRKVATARAVWLFDVSELNPRGRRMEPIHDALKARYRFAEVTPDEKKTGLIFKDGTFSVGNSEIVIDTLEIYTDGVVVNTRSDTLDSDAIMEDALAWLLEDFGLGGTNFGKRVRKLYVSELIVSCPGISIDRGLGALLQVIDAVAAGTGVERSGIETQGLIFGSSERRGLFTFERRIGDPYSSERYFSMAAMQTSDHLRLLETVASLLSQ